MSYNVAYPELGLNNLLNEAATRMLIIEVVHKNQ